MAKRKLILTAGLLALLSGGAFAATAPDTNAPPNSLTVNDNGWVGVGTDDPAARLHVSDSNSATLRVNTETAAVNLQTHGDRERTSRFGQTLAGWVELLQATGNGLIVGTVDAKPLVFGTSAQNRIFIASNGNVGFGGLTNPINPIQHISGAKLTAGGVWTNASSRELKENIHALTASEALEVLTGLNPVHYRYKAEASEDYLGFIAEDVPEPVAMTDRKGLNPMDIIAVLAKVSQEQQQLIREQQRVIREQQLAIEQLDQRMALLEQAQ
jgi:hypothetical protein